MPPIIGPHEAAWVWISGWMGNLNLEPDNTPFTDADVKSSFVDHIGHRNYAKLDTVCTAGKAWTHVTRLYSMVSELRDENKGLTSDGTGDGSGEACDSSSGLAYRKQGQPAEGSDFDC